MKLGKLWAYAFVILLLNSAYLWPLAEPTVAYMSNLVLHMLLGLALAVAAALYLWKHFGTLSRVARWGFLLFLCSALPAVILMKIGAMRPNRWLLHLHIALAIPAAVLLGVAFYSVVNKFSRRFLPAEGGQAENQASAFWRGYSEKLVWRSYLVALSMLAIFPLGVKTYQHYAPFPSDRIHNPMTAPTSMYEEGPGEKSPFFPSSANTTTGNLIPSNFFMTSETCKRCHADIYEQWNSSMHHFSSFNNQWYRKSIEYMQDVVGTKPSKWCAGCHDHAVFFNGRFDTPIKQQINTPEAQAGLACTSCHSIVRVNDSMGNGGFVIEYPALHDMAASQNKFLQWAHDFLIKVDPDPHKKVFMKPFHRKDTAEMCSSCHKVHLDLPVNDYRWLRGFNDYDNWQASGVSGQGARSFYYPKQPQKCVDCHMPLVDSNDFGNINGKVHSHRFPAANTAVPLANQDHKQLQTTIEFLQNKHVTVDIFALSAHQDAREGSVPGAPRPSE
ncbi:MAG TPA: multiheme c-type cytochrome, partial [Terriglobia bacterium]|nr:multiheme c-type cytochrome [Terriglobia bacterium]